MAWTTNHAPDVVARQMTTPTGELAECLGKVFDEFKEAYEKNTGA